MINRFQFLFIDFLKETSPASWADFCASFLEEAGVTATFVGGPSGRWKKAPKKRDALVASIALGSVQSAQGGTNSHSSTPFDGWGLSLSLSAGTDVVVARAVEGVGCGSDQISEWTVHVVEKLQALSPIDYGYAYESCSPKDIGFGMGVICGRPSHGLRNLFGDDERVSRWSRAKMWGTCRGYLYDVFNVNVLDQSRFEKVSAALGGNLPGVVKACGPNTMWLLEIEEERRAAAVALNAAGLCVASHAYGKASQERPQTKVS
ncbi:hypothetical protein [Pseudomarimonas arenosa]|uniref:Uncharacterized protein n=1 Tax=Pseudomarimonas arenosa TaxID=2774145 RepID=A0AAW3ZSR4_9GAMM|nr:hypothetical protein [Pseudomarimonas arenosa]MBD8527241.1 hypothetical protein [Pseudomarimonas arenosa]